MYNDIINENYNNPKYNKIDFNPDLLYKSNNNLCGDELEIWIKFDNDILINYWYIGEISMLTKATCSILWNIIIWKDIHFIKKLRYNDLEKEFGMEIPWRRKNASIYWLLSVINAHNTIHNINLIDFDDLLE